MTENKEWFETYKTVHSGSVIMDDNASCKVFGIKNINVKMFEVIVKTLCDVRHVPGLGKNLISLGTLDSNRVSYKKHQWNTESEKRCHDNNEGVEIGREHL